MLHALSPQQEAVTKAIHNSNSLMVKSVAGSGKTSTGVAAVEGLPTSVLATAVAFNRRNTEDLKMKMPPHVTCLSFNSIGFRSWIQRAHGAKVDTKKQYTVRDRAGIKYENWPQFPRVMSLLRARGFVPPGVQIPARALVEWHEDNLHYLLDSFDLWPELGVDDPFGFLARALNISIDLSWKGCIDFDDQLYMPALWDGSFPPVELLVVDEVQDVSPIQRRLIHQILGGKFKLPNARILALGDENQAIYAFRGADHTSVARFTEEFSCKEMPLTVSFRCPKAITKEAQKMVPHMEAHPDTPEGLVVEGGSSSEPDFQPGDVILCRNNRPLIKLAFKLIAQHKPAKVLGREIGEQILNLLKKMKCQRTKPMAAEVAEYAHQECSKLEAKGRRGSAEHLRDRCGALVVLCQSLGDRPRKELADLVRMMFSNDISPITLSTIHKAKGLEWNNVYFLDRHLIPSRFATTEEEIQQEQNVAYVGVTRAKQTLTYITSER